MEDLKRMAVFTAVVQHGSMSGAARALGMSTSAVSQQVREQESDGVVTLLHRSTRKLALTEAGQRYRGRGVQGIDSARGGAARWHSERPGQVLCERQENPRYWQHRVAP